MSNLGTPALARDRLVYFPAGGAPIEFVPADASVLVADRAVERISVHRPGGKIGQWVPMAASGGASSTSPPPPTPAPVPETIPASTVVEPVIPPLRRMIADESMPRDEAVRLNKQIAGDLFARDLHIDGYEDGVVIEGTGNRPALVENVRVLNTWRTSPERCFKGQGVYADAAGAVTIRGCFGHRLGWRPGCPPADRNNFRHGVYSNFDVASLLIEDSWIDEAACAGIQARGPVIIRRCLITECAVGMLLLAGAVVEEVTVYGGRPRYNPPEPPDPAAGKSARPASWTGDTALSIYHPARVRDLWIVGRTGQADDVDLIPGLRTYHMGAVVGSGSYPKSQWRPPIDARGEVIRDLLTAADSRVVGWPGPAFAGDRPHDGSGFRVGGAAIDVRELIASLRDEALAARTTAQMARVVSRGQRLVRDAAQGTL